MKEFFCLTDGEITADDEMRYAELFSRAREPQDDLRMTGGQLISLNQVLDLDREMEKTNSIRDR